MKTKPSYAPTLMLAALVAAGLAAPLVALELCNGGRAPEASVIATLALLPALAVIAAAPRPGVGVSPGSAIPAAVPTGVRLTLAVLFAAAWLAIVGDQWPCFMGVPNCD